MEQKTAIAHEAKAVLDSWVRYEGQVKQRQQRELAESVIAKIEKELENPKTLKQILDQSVADVESMSFAFGFVIIKADKLQESCRKRHKRQNYQSPFKSSQCYINLCNSQSGPIDYPRLWAKACLLFYSPLISRRFFPCSYQPVRIFAACIVIRIY